MTAINTTPPPRPIAAEMAEVKKLVMIKVSIAGSATNWLKMLFVPGFGNSALQLSHIDQHQGAFVFFDDALLFQRIEFA